MNDAPHPLLDVLVALFCRPGGAGEGAAELHRAHIAWELASGQWVAMAAPDGRLWAWASWYLTDADGIARLRAGGMDEVVRSGERIELTRGDRAYVATALVAPWAPAATYRALYRLAAAGAAAMGARSIAGHLRKRDGRVLYHERAAA